MEVPFGYRQFHLEMQWYAPWHFVKRALFYWAKFHSEQLREGEHYITLRPTITVCFVNQILRPDVGDFHLKYSVIEVKHQDRKSVV